MEVNDLQLDRAIPIKDFASTDFRDRMFLADIVPKGSLYPAGVPTP